MGAKVLDSFTFVDDSRERNRWPEEWFDGQIRRITLDLLDIDPEGDFDKQLSSRRQSLRHKAKSLEGKLRFNWQVDREGTTTGFVLQFVKDKPAK